MNEDSKVVVELCDQKWLWNLTLLCDIMDRLKDFDTKLLGRQKLVSDMFMVEIVSEISPPPTRFAS
jgi:hypothetical protein